MNQENKNKIIEILQLQEVSDIKIQGQSVYGFDTGKRMIVFLLSDKVNIYQFTEGNNLKTLVSTVEGSVNDIYDLKIVLMFLLDKEEFVPFNKLFHS